MDLLLPIVAALVAILIVPGWSFYFDVTPKVVVVLAGAAVALILWRRYPAPGSRRSRWFLWILGFQGFALAAATMFSTHRWFSIYGSTWRRDGFFAELGMLILAAVGATGAGDLRAWLRITVIASIPIGLYAVLQYFGVDPILLPAGYHFGEGKYMIVRPPSTLGHAAYLATYLVYVIFAGAELARIEGSRAWKSAAIFASALALFAMVLSGTRAALAGFLAGVVFMVIRGVSRKMLYGAAAAVVVLAAFYVSPLGERLRARAFWSSEDPLGGSRLALWRDTLRMSVERPLLGYGPETFSIEFPRHQSLELARAFPDFYHESPHNIFLDAFVSKGFVGLMAMLGLATFGFALARGFTGAAFIGILVSQQFTAFTVPTELYLYVVIVMLLRGMDPQSTTSIPVRPFGLAVAVPFGLFAVYLAAGDAWLATAKRQIDQREYDRAAGLIDRARGWHAAADFYFSRRFASAGDADPVQRYRAWQYGLSAAMRAPETADDPQNALLNLAAFQAGLNDAAGVERTLRKAIEAAPNWFKPHWLLAQVLQQQGRSAEAIIEAQAAVERDGGKHPEVIATFERLSTR